MDDQTPDMYSVFLRQLELIEFDLKTRPRSLTPDEQKRFVQVLQYFEKGCHVSQAFGEGDASMTRDDKSVKAGGDAAQGDVIKQSAGRDMKGAVAGRGASSAYAEVNLTTAEDVAALTAAFNQLADEISNSDLPAKDKASLLSSAVWFCDNLGKPDQPGEAREHLSVLSKASGWVGERVKAILSGATGSLLAHWCIQLWTSM